MNNSILEEDEDKKSDNEAENFAETRTQEEKERRKLEDGAVRAI